MHIPVRTLAGKTLNVEATDVTTFKDVRASVEAQLCGSFKILARGIEAPAGILVTSFGLQAGEFLIALPTRKRKAPVACQTGCSVSQATVSTAQAAFREADTGQPIQQPLQASAQESQPAAAAAGKQHDQGNPAETEASAAAGFRQQGLAPPAQQRPELDQETSSPPRDDTGLFTLLPGYISRPNPSPHKPPRVAFPPAPAGGFLRSCGGFAETASLDSAEKKRPRLQPTGESPSGSGELSGDAQASRDVEGREQPTGARLSAAEVTIRATALEEGAGASARVLRAAARAAEMDPAPRRKPLVLPPNPSGMRGTLGTVNRSTGLKEAQDARGFEGREQPGAAGDLEVGTDTSGQLAARPEIDRRAEQPGGGGRDVHISLWEDLARELQGAPITQPESTGDPVSCPAGHPAQEKARGALGAGAAAIGPANAKANKLLKALASEGDPVLAPKGQKAGRRKLSARKLLPGGQDLRLTPQGRLSAKEAGVVAELALPRDLDRLEAIFRALNTVYCFLLLKNIQASWAVVRAAVTAFPEAQDATIADVEGMAELCPEVVFLRDRHSVEGPRSVKELNAKSRARRAGSGEASLDPRADPLSIHGDSFPSAAAEAGEDQRVIEISDAGRHTVTTIARAMARLDGAGSAGAREALGRVEESLAAAVGLVAERAATQQDDTVTAVSDQDSRQRDIDSAGSDGEKDGSGDEAAEQKEKGVKNATLRRCGAFRRGLVRAVMLMHDRFFETLSDSAQAQEVSPSNDKASENTGQTAAAVGGQASRKDNTQAGAEVFIKSGSGQAKYTGTVAVAQRAEGCPVNGAAGPEQCAADSASRPARLEAGGLHSTAGDKVAQKQAAESTVRRAEAAAGAAQGVAAEAGRGRGRAKKASRERRGRGSSFFGGLRRSVGDIRAPASPVAQGDGDERSTMPVLDLAATDREDEGPAKDRSHTPASRVAESERSAAQHGKGAPIRAATMEHMDNGSAADASVPAADLSNPTSETSPARLGGCGAAVPILETTPVARPRGSKKAATGGGPDEARGFDPLKQGCWHSDFPVQGLTVAGIREVVREATQKQALADQQGRVKAISWEDAGKGNAPRPPRLSRKHEPCRDCTHMDVDKFLEHLQGLPWYSGQVTHIENLPARTGAFQETRIPLTDSTSQALVARGISRLFKHQAEAINAAMAGQDVVVSTSTASGKSLCYNIPILEALAADRSASAIYIFPTKALAQDQLRALREFVGAAFPRNTPIADVYDGDTPKEERVEIRERAQLLITNPDMLHQSMLPVHRQFSRILANLRYVIVDEGHAYRGVFGCHTALVLRRLRRVCQREYNITPRFMVTSATIANPRNHICSLLGVEDVRVVSEDGSPHGPQRFVLWNPPLTAPNHALAVANSAGHMSRTEGRARKGERKRAALGYGRKSTEAAAEAADVAVSGNEIKEVEASLSMAAARIHRRRQAANLTAVLQKEPAATSAGIPVAQRLSDSGAQESDSLATSDFAASTAEGDWAVADETADAEQVACENPTAASEPSRVRKGESEARASEHGSGGESSRSKVLRRQLSRSAIQAAMDAGQASRRQAVSASASGVCEGAADAFEAVTGTVMLKGDRPKFEPKDLVYRSDEPGSGHDGRPLLRRRLHGHRFGQKPGKAHPYGMYARVDASTDTQARLPGREWRSKEFRDKWGTAGVSLDQRRKSPIVEISQLLAECVQHGLRTIAFCKTRKLCELVVSYTREMLRESAPHLAHTIAVYRAGYSPSERREIEQALFHGDLWAVAATNALELGLDVGSLDMTMHLGFQGSIASLRQQAGRAGRREQRCMSIYVAFDGPLDQYFMTYPRQLFDRPIEAAHIDPSNLTLLEQHLSCAAAETPLILVDDEQYFGPKVAEAADVLVHEGLVARHPMARHAHALHYIGRYENPAARFSLRAIDPDRYQIINEADGNNVMEEIEESKAFFQVYDGAVYMFQGRTYLCKKLDIATKTAIVRPVDLKYYTSIRDHTDIHVVGGAAAYPTPEAILRQLRGDEEPTMAQCANSEVTTRWLGFHRIRHGTGEIFDTVDLFLPDVQFPTQAAYLRVPQSAKAVLAGEGLPWREGLHAAMHAILNVVPLHMMCGAGDLGAECDNPYSARFRPDRLLVFDRHPGGIGLAYKVCDLFGVLMRKAMALIEACPCTSTTGCPGCIQHTACDQYNAVLNKRAGLLVLGACLQAQAEFRQQLAARSEEIQDPDALLQAAGGRVR